jgi:anti-anti-sigma factor
MNCGIERSGEIALLRITGDMTIENASDLKTVLIDSMADSSHVEINMSEVDTVDVSCLQILCSAHRTAEKEGKKLVVEGIGDALTTCLEDAGLPRHMGCLKDHAETCLWKERRPDQP